MSKYIFATKFKKEPLYYNIQVSVNKDFNLSKGSLWLIPNSIRIYRDSPILFTNNGFNEWSFEVAEPGNIQSFGIRTSAISTTLTHLYFFSTAYLDICEGEYPLPEIISILDKSTNTRFTFTPIPVYE